MCTIINERFSNEMKKVGMTGELLDMQFGRGFTKNILCGQNISIDQTKKLARHLHTTSDYLIGEDLKAGSTANLSPYVEISGKRLKTRRESLGWSQVCLSEMCGMRYPTTISKIEVGQAHTLAKDTMMTLCFLLKCDILYLQGKSNEYGEAPHNLPEGREERQIVSTVQGAVVGRLMNEKGMSPTTISKKIGIPRPVLARIKSGTTGTIPETAAMKLAKVLGAEPSSIIISTKNSKMSIADKAPKELVETPKHVEAEIVEVSGGDDLRVSLNRLAKITAFGEKHPEILSLLDQMVDLKDDQISMITQSLDLMIKGAIVS